MGVSRELATSGGFSAFPQMGDGQPSSRFWRRFRRSDRASTSPIAIQDLGGEEYVIGGERSPVTVEGEYLVTHKWQYGPIQPVDVAPLIQAFQRQDVREQVFNDEAFNARNYPTNWTRSAEVERFERVAGKFWIPRRNPFDTMTIIPTVEGQDLPQNKPIRVTRITNVIRVERVARHVSSVLDNDPYASQEERIDIDSGILKSAYHEGMITATGFEGLGLAALDKLRTYDALFGKNPDQPGSFHQVTLLVNFEGPNAARIVNSFGNYGFEWYAPEKRTPNNGSQRVRAGKAVIVSDQYGNPVRMLRLILTQGDYWKNRPNQVEKLFLKTGIDLDHSRAA